MMKVYRSLIGLLLLTTSLAVTVRSQDEAVELERSKAREVEQSAVASAQMSDLPETLAAVRRSLAGAEPSEVIGALVSEHERLRLVRYRLADGGEWVAPELAIRHSEQARFTVLADGLDPAQLMVFKATGIRLGVDQFAARWSASGMSPVVNPFQAGKPSLYRPRVGRVTESGLKVDYISDSGPNVTVRWALDAHGLRADVSFEAPETADYSVCFAPFPATKKERVSNVLLPPRHQFLRLPTAPRLTLSAFMPNALALVETGGEAPGSGQVTTYGVTTYGVAAEIEGLDAGWPTNDALESPYGFSLLSAEGDVQPTAFAPVLGEPRSRKVPGDTVAISFRVLARGEAWPDTLGFAMRELFEVHDYRSPVACSLSGAALNMFDLVGHETASGWDSELKGFYNIEFKSGVTQSAPLTVLSAALLSRDENLYRERALPTIAYLLSRTWAHFGRIGEVGNWSGAPLGKSNVAPVSLSGPNVFFGTPLWQGLDQLTEGLNPWLEPLVLPDGAVTVTKNKTQRSPAWVSLIAGYRHQPTSERLAEIEEQATRYATSEMGSRDEAMVPITAFYDVNTYPHWFDLPDLYEVVRDPAYLAAAKIGAYHTLAGLWSHPRVKDEQVTIHASGKLTGDTRVLFRGSEWYRLGVTPEDLYVDASGRHWTHSYSLPEKTVPAWEVSAVGLGFEQPSTLYLLPTIKSGEGLKRVLMSANAPALLRLGYLLHDPVLTTAARNLVIGRFANYPGYYYTAPTDMAQDAGLPVNGPDVHRIYYHHIAPHLAFTLDFLVTQAVTRSDGAISFPWAKQQGYAWFNSRVYGLSPGRVFDMDGLRLLLTRTADQAPTPMVDTLFAENDHEVVLIAMSQSDVPLNYVPHPDMEGLHIDRSAAIEYRMAGDTEWHSWSNGQGAQALPAKGLIAYRFKRLPSVAFTPKSPLHTGPVKLDVGTEFGGQLIAYRIRNPYFADAVYVYLRDGGGTDAYAADFTFDEPAKTETRTRFPYEALVYGVASDATASVRVTVTNKITQARKTFLLELNP